LEQILQQRLKAAPSGPRYVTQFVNGTWQVFDTVYYSAVDAKPTQKAADKRAGELNARPRPAARKGGPRK
jgi:hypothetical protein